MKLYDDTRAPNPRRVRIFLAEKGVSVPKEQIAILEGKHLTPEYREVSPLRQVPAFQADDGRTLTESVAICRYFEAIHPDPPLFGGSDPYDQAETEMWNRRMEFGLMMTAAMSFRHSHPAMAQLEKPQIKEWSEINSARFGKFVRFLDGQLKGKEFVAAGRMSMADIIGLTSLDFAALAARLTVPDDCANVKAWHERLSGRESAKA